MIVIGLTGGIASGKSTVANTLAALGAQVINADNLGHELFNPGSDTWDELVSVFGREILLPDNTIDRHKLGEIVFHDPIALKELNSIMHPRMYNEVAAIINSLREYGTQVVVVEAALLVEAGWTTLVDEVWLTTIPENIALERLMSRDNISREKALARICSQIPVKERIKSADVVIDTSASPEQVKAEVVKLWQGLQKKIRPERHTTIKHSPDGTVDMATLSRKTIRNILASREYIPHSKDADLIPAAVVLPLFQKEDGDWFILFTKRTETVATHRGQFSFPGGTWEPQDKTLEDTALRETEEEIGIPPRDIEILGRLENQNTSVRQFTITPFVGVIPYPHHLKLNRHEIDFVIEVPLKYFTGYDALRHSIVVNDAIVYTTYYSCYKGHLIWGVTATILKQFLDMIFTY